MRGSAWYLSIFFDLFNSTFHFTKICSPNKVHGHCTPEHNGWTTLRLPSLRIPWHTQEQMVQRTCPASRALLGCTNHRSVSVIPTLIGSVSTDLPYKQTVFTIAYLNCDHRDVIYRSVPANLFKLPKRLLCFMWAEWDPCWLKMIPVFIRRIYTVTFSSLFLPCKLTIYIVVRVHA